MHNPTSVNDSQNYDRLIRAIVETLGDSPELGEIMKRFNAEESAVKASMKIERTEETEVRKSVEENSIQNEGTHKNLNSSVEQFFQNNLLSKYGGMLDESVRSGIPKSNPPLTGPHLPDVSGNEYRRVGGNMSKDAVRAIGNSLRNESIRKVRYGTYSPILERAMADYKNAESFDPVNPLVTALRGLDMLGTWFNETMRLKGFWDVERNKSEGLMLVVTELSEACESIRKGDPQDEHCPEFTNTEVEIADAMIRLLEMTIGFGWRVPAAMAAKMRFNENRPHKHGKKF